MKKLFVLVLGLGLQFCSAMIQISSNVVYSAILNNNVVFIETMIKTGILEPNQVLSPSGYTPLLAAFALRNFQIFKMLARYKKTDINQVDLLSLQSPLQCACSWGEKEYVRYLLDQRSEDIDVNMPARGGLFPLLITICRIVRFGDDYDILVKLLCHKNIDVNQKNMNGISSIMCAVEGGNRNILGLLLIHPGFSMKSMKEGIRFAKEKGFNDIAIFIQGYLDKAEKRIRLKKKRSKK